MLKIALTTLILVLLQTALFAQKKNFLGKLFLDPYKEAQNIQFTNVNKVITRFDDGLELYLYQGFPASRKVTLTKINTGRIDYEGNTIYHVKLTDNKTNDSVILYPKFEWYPTEYYGVAYIHSGQHQPIVARGEFYVRDIERTTIYGNSAYTTAAAHEKASKVLEEKISYDRKDLLEADMKTRFEAYNDYLKQHEAALASKDYLTEIDTQLDAEYIYYGQYSGESGKKLKVERVRGTDGKIKEVIFKFPFTDGSYPEKEEFFVHAAMNANGLLSITDGKSRMNKGTLLPFDKSVMIGPNSVGEKDRYYHYDYSLSQDAVEIDKMYWMVRYTNYMERTGDEYVAQWKLANTTDTYDYKEKYKFTSFLGNVVLQHYLN